MGKVINTEENSFVGSMQKMIAGLQEIRKLTTMKPSERLQYQRDKRIEAIDSEVKEIDKALGEVYKMDGLDCEVKGDKVFIKGVCEGRDIDAIEGEFDPSLINFSPEEFTQLMMRANEADRQSMAREYLVTKLVLLKAKQEYSQPLPDMTEEDEAFEAKKAASPEVNEKAIFAFDSLAEILRQIEALSANEDEHLDQASIMSLNGSACGCDEDNCPCGQNCECADESEYHSEKIASSFI